MIPTERENFDTPEVQSGVSVLGVGNSERWPLLRIELSHYGYDLTSERDLCEGVEVMLDTPPVFVLAEKETASVVMENKPHQTSAIVLGAKSTSDAAVFLEQGADHVEGNNISPEVLAAHMNAILRRKEKVEEVRERVVCYGGVEVDLDKRIVKVNGERVPMVGKKMGILALFASHKGEVLTPRFIHEKFWGEGSFFDASRIAVQISRLRDKIRDEKQQVIKTIPELGYAFGYDAPNMELGDFMIPAPESDDFMIEDDEDIIGKVHKLAS